ncbi:hypothetical protein LTS16_025833 [Friedmanniomyces endolithicus]|nr:hypothetical protein LTS16_025833 [Friedmanniomyces endolithicus]
MVKAFDKNRHAKTACNIATCYAEAMPDAMRTESNLGADTSEADTNEVEESDVESNSGVPRKKAEMKQKHDLTDRIFKNAMGLASGNFDVVKKFKTTYDFESNSAYQDIVNDHLQIAGTRDKKVTLKAPLPSPFIRSKMPEPGYIKNTKKAAITKLKADPTTYSASISNFPSTFATMPIDLEEGILFDAAAPASAMQAKMINDLKAQLGTATTELTSAHETVSSLRLRARTLGHFNDENTDAWATWVTKIKHRQAR